VNADLVLGPLKQTDYPQVKFWYGEDWTNFCVNNQALRGLGQVSQLINCAADMQFIEDRHGIAMDAFSMSMVRSLAQAIWVGFGTVGAAPLTWEEADEKTRHGYYTAMCAGFFELRLCDSNWKAETVATNTYHLWLSSWKLQMRPPALDGKRVCDASTSAGPSKKLRVTGAVSTNILFADHTSMLRLLPRWTVFSTKKIRARECEQGCPTPQGTVALH
jgi:hypothetical protein